MNVVKFQQYINEIGKCHRRFASTFNTMSVHKSKMEFIEKYNHKSRKKNQKMKYKKNTIQKQQNSFNNFNSDIRKLSNLELPKLLSETSRFQNHQKMTNFSIFKERIEKIKKTRKDFHSFHSFYNNTIRNLPQNQLIKIEPKKLQKSLTKERKEKLLSKTNYQLEIKLVNNYQKNQLISVDQDMKLQDQKMEQLRPWTNTYD